MSEKKVNNSEITYKGNTYALIFNLNVMEEVQEEYGSVEAWGEMVEDKAEPNAKAIKFGFTAMLNEGIDIYNEENEDTREPFTTKQVGRIISELGLSQVAKKLNKTVIDSTKSDEKN